MFVTDNGITYVQELQKETDKSASPSIAYYLAGELIDDPAKAQPNRIRSDYGGRIYVGLFGSDAAATRGSLYFAAQAPFTVQLMRYTYDQAAVYSMRISSVDPWYAAYGLYVAMNDAFYEDVPNLWGIPFYYGRGGVTQFCIDITGYQDVHPAQPDYDKDSFLAGLAVGRTLAGRA